MTSKRLSPTSRRTVRTARHREAVYMVAMASLTVVFSVSVSTATTIDRSSTKKAVLIAASTSVGNAEVSSYLQLMSSRNAAQDLERLKASRDAQELYLKLISNMQTSEGNASSLATLLQQLKGTAAGMSSVSPQVKSAMDQTLSSLRSEQQTTSLSTQDYLKALNQVLSSMQSKNSNSSVATTKSSTSSTSSSSRLSSSVSSSSRSSATSAVTSSAVISSVQESPISSSVSSGLTPDQERELLIQLLQLMLEAQSSSSVSSTVSSVSSVIPSIQSVTYNDYVIWMKSVADQGGVHWTALEAAKLQSLLPTMTSVQASLARKLTESLTLQEPAAHNVLAYVLTELPASPTSPQRADMIFSAFKQENGRLLMVRGYVANPDVDPKDWYAPAVMYVLKQGLMKGQADGFFAPEKTLNQAELAVILANAMGRSTQPVLRQSGAFASWPSWAQDAISSLRAKGVNILFFTASATAPVTRLQVARAITETVLLGKQADPTKVQSFSDTVRLPPEYLRYVNLVSSLGVMTGKAGGTLFDPYGFLNRAEAAKIFGKAIDVRAGR